MTHNDDPFADDPFETPQHEIDGLVRDQLWAEVPTPGDGYWGDIHDRIDQTIADQHSGQDNLTSETPAVVGAIVTDISPAAREQKKGDTEPSRRRKLALWPAAVAAAIIAVALVVTSNGFGLRNNEVETGFADDDGIEGVQADVALGPKLNLDHWHAVYGVWDCTADGGQGAWVPAFQSTRDDSGIHSHGDGLIHIHPFFESSAGANAQLGLFANEMGITLTDSVLELDTGQVLIEGDDCGGEPSVLHLRRWKTDIELLADPDTPPTIVTTNLASERFFNDREVWTIALAPLDADVPLPPQARFDLMNLVTSPPDSNSDAPFSSVPFDGLPLDADPDGFVIQEDRGTFFATSSGPRPTANEFFTILARRDIDPSLTDKQDSEFFTLLPPLPSARALELTRYRQESPEGGEEICVRALGGAIDGVCSDGSPTEGTDGNVLYVLDPKVLETGAWMVVELGDGTSVAVNVENNLAYVEWSSDRGPAIRTVILDAELNEVEVRE